MTTRGTSGYLQSSFRHPAPPLLRRGGGAHFTNRAGAGSQARPASKRIFIVRLHSLDIVAIPRAKEAPHPRAREGPAEGLGHKHQHRLAHGHGRGEDECRAEDAAGLGRPCARRAPQLAWHRATRRCVRGSTDLPNSPARNRALAFAPLRMDSRSISAGSKRMSGSSRPSVAAV